MTGFPLLFNPINLHVSYKNYLDFLGVLEEEKKPIKMQSNVLQDDLHIEGHSTGGNSTSYL